jgi:putative SOS response-associated peptidase YedK
MCSHYIAERRRAFFEKRGYHLPLDWDSFPGTAHIYPTQFAPIIRRPPERDSGDEAVPEFEVIPARFGLLPGFAKEVKYGVRTYNARSETVATLASFKAAWSKARHCIVPCEAIYEPDWRTGKHVPTKFTAADEGTLGVAGLWQSWRSPEGDWVNSFTMLTINADSHPLMKHMHRPDPKRPVSHQDKRMVAILHESQYAEWLDAPVERSMAYLLPYPAERMLATPEPAPAANMAAKKAETPGLF